ncbi:hypothetical protein [Salmonella enterica]|uniref:hypothetical protein n=1 Tax=Salmonella enterica TaxID=28901 RepID=UPI0004010C31|nr:hypothetical protein [Salmonella enterica]EDP9262228.1 hypothetical protein [Salmonella enterica subsp. houtenae]EDS5927361.1 hypothetical protein [Salmonella enterica subsp. enterica serovar Lexington]EDT6485130.1 hypothetical protein [Salmonella enterica subsp. enterica]EDX8060451.1 hypothetical protein [Salmonella enterica subsp. enterica serovar Java]EEM2536316.1 hypothetical protein [Salmonella enterica subsp. enterica serovar Morehead]EHC7507784.1 hypothetical protein [Salmonella ent
MSIASVGAGPKLQVVHCQENTFTLVMPLDVLNVEIRALLMLMVMARGLTGSERIKAG